MKILVKYPTRERPEQFYKTISGYIENSVDKENIFYLVSLDENDPRLNAYISILSDMNNPNIDYVIGESNGKIFACNRDMQGLGLDWDICILASDDMVSKEEAWDLIIVNCFEENFKDLDGVLWFDDGFQSNICCQNIVGKKYYDRFGYLYHPDYYSLFCDDEFTNVAILLGKMYKDLTMCLFFHEHPARSPKYKSDNLMKKNESYYFKDKEVYDKRKALNFP